MPETTPRGYITGYCSTGAHEGTKPKSLSGQAMKTCGRIAEKAGLARDPKTGKPTGERADVLCTCKCHTDLDKLFELSGMERVIQDNPEYHPPKSDYWMPSLAERVASSIAAASVPTRVIESAAPDVAPPTVVREFAPTATGRSARGELEMYVKLACDEWLIDGEGALCTPAYIAARVARKMGVGKAPSQGAVNAVLERWVKLGFADVAKKPTRFVKYTTEGVALGLEALKLRAKDRRAASHSAAQRGLRTR